MKNLGVNKESALIEYKRELVDSFERSIVAFLNSTGGHIYVGINDDCSVFGVNEPDMVQRQIADRILNNIRPNAIGLFNVISEIQGGKTVIHVIVSGGLEKPYYLKKAGMTPNGCFVRIGSTVHCMSEKMILESFASRAKLSLAKIPAPRQDLTFSQLKIYYEENKKPLNSQFAKMLELLTPDGKYNYNAYLLADENCVSMKVARYKGTDKYDLIESEEFGYCCIVKALKAVLMRMQVANITQTKITPMERVEKPLVDPVALREAVINAVVHNDYTREVPPLFEIFSDRMEITNYGGLVEGLSREDFFNCCSMPRNRELMRVFYDLDLVEQLGSGMRRILRSYDEKTFSFTDHFMRTSFYFEGLGHWDDRINDRINDRIKGSLELSVTEHQIFTEIRRNPFITVPLLMKETGFSEPTINRTLKVLRERSLIKRVGARKKGHWEIIGK